MYEKLKSWLPPHFTGPDYESFLRAAAVPLDEALRTLGEFIKNTTIGQSDLEYTGAHAVQRGVPRVKYGAVPEEDRFWRNRIQRIKYNRTAANIIANVRSVVDVRRVRVLPDHEGASFLSGAADKRAAQVAIEQASYGWYGPVGWNRYHNGISILIETPIPDPDSHYDDDFFYDDEAFMGTRERQVDEHIIRVLKTLIGKKVPAGAPWRLLARGFTGLVPGTLAEQEAELNSF